MDEITNGPKQRGRLPALRRVGLVAAGLGVGVTLGAAGIAGAATDPPKPPANGSTVAPPPPGHRGGPHGKRGPDMGPRGAIRGELVVPDGKGGFRTVKVQRGEVTAVTPTSLVVKSPDGVSQTWVLDKATVVNGGRSKVGDIKAGDKVRVLANAGGTATHVRDVTRLPADARRPGPPPGAPGAVPGGYDDEGDVQPA